MLIDPTRDLSYSCGFTNTLITEFVDPFSSALPRITVCADTDAPYAVMVTPLSTWTILPAIVVVDTPQYGIINAPAATDSAHIAFEMPSIRTVHIWEPDERYDWLIPIAPSAHIVAPTPPEPARKTVRLATVEVGAMPTTRNCVVVVSISEPGIKLTSIPLPTPLIAII
jgi:hypothetical protein